MVSGGYQDKGLDTADGKRLSELFVMALQSYVMSKKLFLVNVMLGVIGRLQPTSVVLPENSTWLVMSHLPQALDQVVGKLYGLRTWIEYGFKQCKNNLGWAAASSNSLSAILFADGKLYKRAYLMVRQAVSWT